MAELGPRKEGSRADALVDLRRVLEVPRRLCDAAEGWPGWPRRKGGAALWKGWRTGGSARGPPPPEREGAPRVPPPRGEAAVHDPPRRPPHRQIRQIERLAQLAGDLRPRLDLA